MTGKGDDLVRGKHFGLGVELGFEFGVIDLGVSGADHQNAAVLCRKGEGLGNA